MRTCINKTPYNAGEVIGVAMRDNNVKRGYLLVNRFQAKHVPVSPGRALGLFRLLGREIYGDLMGKTVTFIGFAETATAIGACLAVDFPGTAYLLQTTRERIDPGLAVVDFQEEHSHAVQQRLFCRDAEAMLRNTDMVVFVEDEITTGKTICNFVEALGQRGITGSFAAASIINNMSREHLERFHNLNIKPYYLMTMEERLENLSFFGSLLQEDCRLGGGGQPTASVYPIEGRPEPRTGLTAADYRKACERLGEEICALFPQDGNRTALVLGTEECMYPAILAAAYLEERWPDTAVRVHATTRSPILPMRGQGYPLDSRCRLASMYEEGRQTFLYNLGRYDEVIIVTDAAGLNPPGLRDLTEALRGYGNENISLVRWIP